MTLGAFIRELCAGGRCRLPRPGPFGDADLADAEAALVELDALARQDWPGTPPPCNRVAARWAALALYRACQFCVHRELGADEIAEALGKECPGPIDVGAHYSADLTFCCLPGLLRQARERATDDPLVAALHELAMSWPLSSVGVPDLPTAPDPAPILTDASLRRVYVDRILRERDYSRLGPEAVRQAVREAVGDQVARFPGLAEALAAADAPRPNPVPTPPVAQPGGPDR